MSGRLVASSYNQREPTQVVSVQPEQIERIQQRFPHQEHIQLTIAGRGVSCLQSASRASPPLSQLLSELRLSQCVGHDSQVTKITSHSVRLAVVIDAGIDPFVDGITLMQRRRIMQTTKKFWLLVVSTLLLMFGMTPKDRAQESPQVFSAVNQFSLTQNPNGPWSYGFTDGLAGPFTLFTSTAGPNGTLFQGWYGPSVGFRWCKQTIVSEI